MTWLPLRTAILKRRSRASRSTLTSDAADPNRCAHIRPRSPLRSDCRCNSATSSSTRAARWAPLSSPASTASSRRCIRLCSRRIGRGPDDWKTPTTSSRSEPVSDWMLLELRKSIEEDRYAIVIDQNSTRSQSVGINAIPAHIFGRRYLVMGAQPYEAFKRGPGSAARKMSTADEDRLAAAERHRDPLRPRTARASRRRHSRM